MEWIRQATESGAEFHVRVVATLAVLAVVAGLRYFALRLVHRRVDDAKVLYQWRKTVTYVTYLVAFLFVARIWIEEFRSVSTFLGLLSAGLAIALRDPLVNLAGWLFLLWRRPFDVGDRIQIGEHRGDVIDIRVFQFTLMEIGNWIDADQSTGRIIHIPNGKIFVEPQANYSRGFQYIWNEIPVLVTFESDWQKAKAILTAIAEKKTGRVSNTAEEAGKSAVGTFMIYYRHMTLYNNLSPVVYTAIADSGVLLTVRYVCEPRKRRSSQEEMTEDILVRFTECDNIDFAYPTSRIYHNALEGKPGARASQVESVGAGAKSRRAG